MAGGVGGIVRILARWVECLRHWQSLICPIIWMTDSALEELRGTLNCRPQRVSDLARSECLSHLCERCRTPCRASGRRLTRVPENLDRAVTLAALSLALDDLEALTQDASKELQWLSLGPVGVDLRSVRLAVHRLALTELAFPTTRILTAFKTAIQRPRHHVA